MVKALTSKIKPTKGFAHVFHIVLSAVLPALLFVLVRLTFVQAAVIVLLLTKWRIFAVRPRFWLAIIRANAVDTIVGLATIVFMTPHQYYGTPSVYLQLLLTLFYIVWQLWIKPSRAVVGIAAQALIGQTYGLMALFIALTSAPLVVLVVITWGICYLSARHFLSTFDEPHSSLYAHTWGYFAAALAWLSVHWLLFYSVVAQPTLLLTVLGFGLGGLYYLQETDRLSVLLRRQVVFIMIAVIVVVLVFSDWGDKAL